MREPVENPRIGAQHSSRREPHGTASRTPAARLQVLFDRGVRGRHRRAGCAGLSGPAAPRRSGRRRARYRPPARAVVMRLAIAGGASAAQYARAWAIKINREKSKVTETRYTPELAEKDCGRMAEGASLREVCRDNGMPESSVRQWVRDDRDGFAARYQAARALQAVSWSDQIIEIGNREDLDPQDKRVRCDNLKWLMSKLLPKRYGDRLLVAGDAENPLQVLHQQVSLVDLTDVQLEALDKFTRSLSEAKQQ